MPNPSGNERDLVQVIKVGTALSMGLMAAFLFSLKQVHPSIELRFGIGTVAAFVIAWAISWRFCTVLTRSDDGSATDRRKFVVRWMVGFMSVAGLGTLAAFGYALKDVSATSRWDVIEGTGLAVLVLSIGGTLIYKAFQFFEEQSEIELEQQRRDHEADEESDGF